MKPFAMLCLLPLVLAVCVSPLARHAVAAEAGHLDVDVERLQTTLETGLLARRPAEFQFIGRVVLLVASGRLPLPMVETTFHWARRKHAKYPFPYFEIGLRIRAREIGIEI
jgi:hypothetical protein